MSTVDTSHLQALGGKTLYSFDGPQPSVLEKFAAPFDQLVGMGKKTSTIRIEAPEFTSLCPLTGQPDFATIAIDYEPDAYCVESKSLKLYLMSFRNAGEFHEACVNRIANDLISLLAPKKLCVEGRFTPRGGIPFWPKVEYKAETRLGALRRCSLPGYVFPDRSRV